MTSFVERDYVTAADDTTLYTPINSEIDYHKTWQRRRRHVLKSKEHSYKLKCSKILKKKLKKYKLRQDGREDQDVLDVSKTLVSTLIIKSPKNHICLKESDVNCFDELRPRNYLFKMVRQKKSIQTGNVKSHRLQVEQNGTIEKQDAITKEIKHTNAFQLLMDSRNKTIGSNSPGKERSDDDSENEEVMEKKNIKMKRRVLLEKMAEAKGARKNKEMEEYQDKVIKKKIDKRAERFKLMILKESKPDKLNGNLTLKQEVENSKLNQNDVTKFTDCNKESRKAKTFTIVDIFNTMTEPVILSPEKKYTSKEDKEFLKKLSPSMRKKESMLSYFKKVEKEPEYSSNESDNDNLIKVKLQMKSKKKGKKKKLSLKRNTVIADEVNVNDENSEITSNLNTPLPNEHPECLEKLGSKRQKRKRSQKIDNNDVSVNTVINSDSRPKRSIKRPVKYTDDTCMPSSDDELLIFTHKKKKCVGHNSNNHKVTVSIKPEHVLEEGVTKPIKEKNVSKELIITKKSVKLAPIFAPKQLNSAALEAKQKFLQSGVPEKLKKIIQQQKNHSATSSDFPVVVHVQQGHSAGGKSIPLLPNLIEDTIEDVSSLNLSNFGKDAYKKLLKLQEVSKILKMDISSMKNIQATLQSIKQSHPKFPVYQSYRYFRGKRKGQLKDSNIDFNNSIEFINDEVDIYNDCPDKLNWTDKYKAMSTNQVIGNFESIKELRKWLISWSENESKANSRGNKSDSSDYYQSDTDSRDSLKTTNNLLIVTGPTGCGKTSSVYTVAAELAIKVIEVNASSKRTGKIMLQDLQEATQSHKVNRSTSNTDNSQKSQEQNLTELLKKNKRKGRPKKITEKSSKRDTEILSSTTASQESTRTCMSLILVDDADIVFDQDDGFTSAIVQLVQCSKRPVILITSSLICPHLQRFLMNGKILKMCPLSPRLLGPWLDIMCLADSSLCWPGLGSKFLNYFNGDMRKTINYLQFYIPSYARSISNEETIASHDIDSQKSTEDENSNMSWADTEDSNDKKLTPVAYSNTEINSNTIWTHFVDGNLNSSRLRHPIQLFNIWWSIPHLFDSVPIVQNTTTPKNKKPARLVAMEMEAIANVIDSISIADCTTNAHPDVNSDITVWPWCNSETNSVSEQDNVDYYMNNHEVGNEISHTLVSGYISVAQDVLHCDRNMDIAFPGMSLKRERDRVITRHKNLTSFLSPSATLDRRSLALDYWSSCRSICRIEKSKSDTQVNLKRNNRFCHYLKSLSVLCKSDAFDNLCDSLSDQGTELKIYNFNE